MALSIPLYGCLLAVRELKREGRVLPCLTSAGTIYIRQLKFSVVLCVSQNDAENAMSIDFGVRNKI